MKNTRKLLISLIAGATLGMAAPVFADSHSRGHDRYSHNDHRGHDRHNFRGHDRHVYHGYGHRPVVVARPYYVQRPVYVEQPMYYAQPQQNMGLGAIIGAAIGGMIDNQQ